MQRASSQTARTCSAHLAQQSAVAQQPPTAEPPPPYSSHQRSPLFQEANSPPHSQQQQQHSDQQQHNNNNNNNNNCNKPKRNPFCSRCRNHGKTCQVKGHKRHCEYRECQCEGCKLVEVRQMVSAAQIKRRRYQKQDEECGRHIEISPPVLKHEPDSNQAALIAKTLISSASSSHVLGRQVSPANQHHQQHHQQQQQHHHHHSKALSISPAAAAFSSMSAILLPPFLNEPSIREQVSLVEEIHQACGPLAIYAWLRAERFDLRKIRDQIEFSRASFDELLQMTGHTPLDLTSPIVD